MIREKIERIILSKENKIETIENSIVCAYLLVVYQFTSLPNAFLIFHFIATAFKL